MDQPLRINRQSWRVYKYLFVINGNMSSLLWLKKLLKITSYYICRLNSSHHNLHSGSESDLQVRIYYLLLINSVSRVRACLSIWLERFRGNQKEDERGPLVFNSSMLIPVQMNSDVRTCFPLFIIRFTEMKRFLENSWQILEIFNHYFPRFPLCHILFA
jgi:hypothetical protein